MSVTGRHGSYTEEWQIKAISRNSSLNYVFYDLLRYFITLCA